MFMIFHFVQQKHYRSQQASSAQSTVVSSIIKDRPALSITALQGNNKTTSQSTATVSTPPSALISTKPMRTDSPYVNSAITDSILQNRWRQRPRHNVPRPTPGATDPRSMLNPSMLRKEGPRFKGPATSPGAFASQPPRPQASTQLNNPAALLSRLPGLQIKQRPHPSMPHPQDVSTTRQQPEPAEKLQKMQLASVQPSKAAISISKISTSSLHSSQGSNTADNLEAKKRADPNFDIITLD